MSTSGLEKGGWDRERVGWRRGNLVESSPGKLPALEQSTQWFYCICICSYICACFFNYVGILASNCLRPNFFNVSSSFAFGSVPLHLVLFLIVFVSVRVSGVAQAALDESLDSGENFKPYLGKTR